jgi:uncharacterized protein YfcZ (UPF0381/DUF406 family)
MASPTEAPSPLAPSTNVRVGFFVDQYNVVYSKCKDVFLGVKNPTEALALSSNQVLFLSTTQIVANGKEVKLLPISLSVVSVFDKEAHYDFWGVIPININPMSRKKAAPVASAEDLMIQNTVTHQVAEASYYIEQVYRRTKNLHNKPQELIRKPITIPAPITHSLPPQAVSIVKAVAKVEIAPKAVKELIKKERLSMSQTLDNFIDSAAEATAALAKLVSDAKALAKDPPTATTTIVHVDAETEIAYELSPSDIKASYLVATAQRKSMVEGLQILSKALLGYAPKINRTLTRNPNSSYSPSLRFIAGELDGLADALQVAASDTAPKTYLKSLGGYLRNYSFSVSFLLMQMKSYPCFSQDTTVEKELSINIHKISKAIQEDLTTLRNNANLLDV